MDNAYCKHLTNSLAFHQEFISNCVTLQDGEFISYYDAHPQEIVEKIINYKNKKNYDKNNIPNECKGCIYKKEENIFTDKIQEIYLYHWYHCNCKCFYCAYRDKTKGEFSDKEKYGSILVYDTLKELYKRNQIDTQNLHVNFGGGELGVLKEFPKLVDLFLKNNVNNIWCESSGIKYSKALEKAIRLGKAGLTVAVCSGSRETYKKIKNRDKYNQVMNNLKNYVKAAQKFKLNNINSLNVISKYIILKGFNNNIDEVEKWLQESKKYGIEHVEISMEFCWGIHTKAGQKVEKYNYQIFDYVEKRCKEIGLALRKNNTSIEIMKKGTY